MQLKTAQTAAKSPLFESELNTKRTIVKLVL
jgi:hypothetical protein